MDRVTDFIVGQKPICVTISGGEVLLVFDLIKPYINKMLKSGIQIRLFTNGSLVTSEIAEFCVQNDIHIMLSFPSCDPVVFEQTTKTKGSYERTLKGMDILKRFGVNFQPNIVVTTLNLHTVSNTVMFLHNHYAPEGIFVSRVTMPNHADDQTRKLLLSNKELEEMFDTCVALSKKYPIRIKTCGGFPLCAFHTKDAYRIFGKICGAGGKDIVVTSDGNIRACTRDEHVYGNIFNESFDEIRLRIQNWRKSEIPAECRGCHSAEICRGGCHMASTNDTRSPSSLDANALTKRSPLKIKVGQQRPRRFHTYALKDLKHTEFYEIDRLSCGITYDFFAPHLASYILSCNTVSVQSLKKELDLSTKDAKEILIRLLRIGAIE